MTPTSIDLRRGHRTRDRARQDSLAGLPAAFWLAIATAITLLLHLPFLNLPMISDEGGYAYTAQRWMDGRGHLYHDIWISRPQGIFVIYAAIFDTLGSGAIALRVGALIAAVATMLVVWRFATLLAGPRVAAMSALIFAVLCGSPAIEGFTANAEVFMALPAALCALLLLMATRRGWTWWLLLAAGAMAGIATIVKPAAVTMLPMGVVFAWLCAAPAYGKASRRASWFVAGFALALAPALIHGYLVGWDAFEFAVITYRMNHQSTAANGLYRHAAGILTMLYRAWPVILLVAVPIGFERWINGERRLGSFDWFGRLAEANRVGIVASPPRRLAAIERGEAHLLLRLWMVACLAGIAMGGDWWVHYLIQIVAPLSIVVACKLARVERLLGGAGQFALYLSIGFLLLVPYRVAAAGDDATISRIIFHHAGYGDQEAVAKYLRDKTPPETRIYAAFNEAALYYLADRPSSYRYLFDQELIAFPDTEQRLIAMVKSPDGPRYIIGTKQGAPFPDRGRAFWAAVAANYHIEAIVHGVPIFRADSRAPRQLLIE